VTFDNPKSWIKLLTVSQHWTTQILSSKSSQLQVGSISTSRAEKQIGGKIKSGLYW